ncbi:DUF1120 domain-containing protein [Pseudomonas sp. GD03860]|uniref:DUF1120 domain-containing protein n=1 Tax=Pseudomonas TaxID=286 RepID=UPI00236420E3|nr:MULTISPECIES: DUF1120 domain-containing protein [Pseudomonas]MDD2060850.1 DUF1120 domain-containing protein [Pseudomonas putida]MDH0638332.1 DUF1120 domain-containing protein [Pseudomonas sp. GD03860]
MKRLLPLALALAGVLPPLAAQADDCRLLSSPEQIDYGTIDRTRLSPQQPTLALPEKTVQIHLSCTNPNDLGLFFKAEFLDNERWRLNDSGLLRIKASNAVVDGEPVELGLLSHPGASPGPAAASLAWRPQQGVAPVRAGQALGGRSLSLTLTFEGELSASAFQVRDMIQSTASGQLHAPATGATTPLDLHWQIQPAACTPQLSNNGVVDYGTIAAQSLQAERRTRLPSRHLNLSINCDSPARYALLMHDNRDGTALVNSMVFYGLGLDASDNRIGLYEVVFDPKLTSADQLPAVYLTYSTGGGTYWSSSSAQSNSITSKTLLALTDEDNTVKGPVPFRTLSTSIEIKPVIAPTLDLDLRQDILLDGAATIEIVYL